MSQNPLPVLGNLDKHLKLKHPGIRLTSKGSSKPLVSGTSGSLKAATMMEHHFTEHALLNPMIPETQAGFNKLFCKFVIETNQPFSIGRAPSLAKLFRFVHVSLTFIESFSCLLGF
jgi:hypothetical protein